VQRCKREIDVIVSSEGDLYHRDDYSGEEGKREKKGRYKQG